MSLLFSEDDFKFFKKIILRAGKMALEIQNGIIDINRKADSTIVTQADFLVQDYLTDAIKQQYDNIYFILEEQTAGGNQKLPVKHNPNAFTAIIDPIDGTAMYSMHLPIWCISIGIFDGYIPRYGFVYAPGFNMFFYNDDTHAFLNEMPISVNRNVTIDSECNMFISSELKHTFNIKFPGKIRNLGSTALHACLTIDNIRNRTLAFIGKSSIWDWAGSIPIILKAGGNINYLSGRAVAYEDIINNNNSLPEYLVVYNCDDFNTIRTIINTDKMT